MRLAYEDVGSDNCVVLIHGHPFDRTVPGPKESGSFVRVRFTVGY